MSFRNKLLLTFAFLLLPIAVVCAFAVYNLKATNLSSETDTTTFLLCALFLLVLGGISVALYSSAAFARPLKELSQATEKLSRGDTVIDSALPYEPTGDVATFTASVKAIAARQKELTATIRAMSNGDLMRSAGVKGDSDELGKAVIVLSERLQEQALEINEITADVANQAKLLLDSAVNLLGTASSGPAAVSRSDEQGLHAQSLVKAARDIVVSIERLRKLSLGVGAQRSSVGRSNDRIPLKSSIGNDGGGNAPGLRPVETGRYSHAPEVNPESDRRTKPNAALALDDASEKPVHKNKDQFTERREGAPAPSEGPLPRRRLSDWRRHGGGPTKGSGGKGGSSSTK